MLANAIRIRAFAKINLDLHIAGIRPDGYHELRTTFQTIDLHDTLTLTPTRGPFRLVCNDAACPADETNLVWRAAEAVWRAARRRGAPEDVRVRIDKRIPMQAGLGGGSSDGAAALRAFAAFWRIAIGADRLRRLAAALGADVPFFLKGGTALGVNRGDVLRAQANRSPAWVVLVVPDFGVSTRDAFAWWDAVNRIGAELPPSPVGFGGQVAPPGAHDRRGNDLQSVVAERHPEIGTIAEALVRAGARQAAMSGSGSAVFGLFATKRAATAAAAKLRASTRRTLLARTLSRMEFQKRSRPVRVKRSV
jgi:4-diphosphocytidyl-2-C-methyl-D-erythritol kinase